MALARRAALALALGLTIAIVLVAPAGVGDDSPRGASGEGVALVARHDAVQPAAVRLDREHPRESLTSQRLVKHLLIVVALVAGLWASTSGGRRAIARTGYRLPLTSRWFRSGGRAPPRAFQLSVI